MDHALMFADVEIPSYEAAWKAGDRFGVVVSVSKFRRTNGLPHLRTARIKLASGKIIRTELDACRVVKRLEI